MWIREEIKGDAKRFLKLHYWKPVLVCFIYTLISGISNGIMSADNDYIAEIYREARYYGREGWDRQVRELFVFLAIIWLILTIISYVLEVGKSQFFLQAFRRDVSIGNLFSGFKYYEIFTILGTQFLRRFYNALWYLLFFIPGIIKSYEYRFVPYILAEEPYLSPNDIISKSREITDGHKFDIFILDLSFIGWYLLGIISFGIGFFFINPYIEATNAKLYNELRGYDEDRPLVSS